MPKGFKDIKACLRQTEGLAESGPVCRWSPTQRAQAGDLAVKVYEATCLPSGKATDKFPKHQLYTLTSQMQRAAISVPANIAEGLRPFGERFWTLYYSRLP